MQKVEIHEIWKFFHFLNFTLRFPNSKNNNKSVEVSVGMLLVFAVGAWTQLALALGVQMLFGVMLVSHGVLVLGNWVLMLLGAKLGFNESATFGFDVGATLGHGSEVQSLVWRRVSPSVMQQVILLYLGW